jgi:pyrimidine operon attenuation protein/uracil phosphoribosyltransferase
MASRLMDEAEIGRAVTRISHEILERNKGAEQDSRTKQDT